MRSHLALAWVAWLALACACDSAPPSLDAGLDAAVQADGGVDAATAPDPRFDALAAAIESDIARSNATGASVAVWLDDEIVWVGGFGTVDPDGSRVPDEDTLFMIGSDTKKIAAMLFLQEVAAGHATVETTLGEVVPELVMPQAPDYPTVTARELMSHQGGIVDRLGDPTGATTDDFLRTYALGAFATDAYAMAPHGVFFNYSNPNFAMVGLMTETLAGEPWADLAETRLFAPLGMTRTFARKPDLDENVATGVGVTAPGDTAVGPVSLADTWEDAFVRPAGLVWSTPSDQVRLARFLVDGDDAVLPAALVAQLHEPQVRQLPDLPGEYGYGLFVGRGANLAGTYADVEVWRHGGNTFTHTSTFYILPEQRFAISILSNGLGDDFTASVVTAIRTLVDLPAPVDPPPPPTVDVAQLDDLTGVYVDPTTSVSWSSPASTTTSRSWRPTSTPRGWPTILPSPGSARGCGGRR